MIRITGINLSRQSNWKGLFCRYISVSRINLVIFYAAKKNNGRIIGKAYSAVLFEELRKATKQLHCNSNFVK